MIRSPLVLAMLGAAAFACMHAQAAPRADAVARAGDLICDLRASGADGAAARSGESAMMLIIERRQSRIRVFSSRQVEPREAVVRSGDTGVHFVEDINGSVRVTSLLACELPEATGGDGRSGEDCQRWSAVQAWHFDTGVHRDPDTSFRRLPGTSYRGSCEPWHLGPRQPLRPGP